jgi:signal transduction histidine kinase
MKRNMFLFSYLAGTFALFCLLFVGLILSQRKRKALATYLCLVVLGSGLWAFSNAAADFSHTKSAGVFWSGVAVVTFLFLTSSFLVFVAYFLHEKRVPSRLRVTLCYLPSIILSLFAFSHWSTVDIIVLYDRPSQTIVGPLYLICLVFLYLAFFFSYYKLIRRYTHLKRHEQLQTVYIILGSLVMLLSVTAFDILLPLRGELRFFSVGPLSTAFLIASLSYAIFRHRLLDIRIVVQRSLIYGALLAIVVSFYLVNIFLLGILFRGSTNSTVLLSAGVTALVGIFGVPHVERFFRKATDRFFFKDRYDYSETLHELSEVLAKNIEGKALLRKTTDLIREHLKIAKITFVAEGKAPPRATTSFAGSMAVPVMLEDKPKGTLLFGEKRSGDAYTAADIKLLTTFSYELAVALEKAELYNRLKEYSIELERKVAERTTELRQLQEEQKQVMLDISHGLQTPLTVIKGELHFLKKQLRGNKHIGMFERSIDEVSTFIYDLLHLAQLEATDGNAVKKPVNASKLLAELVEYCRHLGKEQRAVFTHDIEPGITVRGSKEKLAELVINLVGNAMKYAKPRTAPHIHIGLSTSGNEAVLIVKDDGIGMSEKDARHIFRRFYRIRDTRTMTKKGTGLGLAICKKIAEQHGGTIAAQSSPGVGTTVIVRLPIGTRV